MVTSIMIGLSGYCGEVDFLSLLLLPVMVLRCHAECCSGRRSDSSTSLSTASSAPFVDP
jgi:hypothetical protein